MNWQPMKCVDCRRHSYGCRVCEWTTNLPFDHPMNTAFRKCDKNHCSSGSEEFVFQMQFFLFQFCTKKVEKGKEERLEHWQHFETHSRMCASYIVRHTHAHMCVCVCICVNSPE